MSQRDVVAVLMEIVDLLNDCQSSPDKASWLAARSLLLQDRDLDEHDRLEILADIRRHIPGMNGLVDVHLTPPPDSSHDEVSAYAKLVELADELHELTLAG